MRSKSSPEKDHLEPSDGGAASAAGEPSDDLDALAGLVGAAGDEREGDLDDELDLDKLSAVARGRTTQTQESDAAEAATLRIDPSAMSAPSIAPASKPAAQLPKVPASEVAPRTQEPLDDELRAPARAPASTLVPLLLCLAIGLGVAGFALGRSSREPSQTAGTRATAEPAGAQLEKPSEVAQAPVAMEPAATAAAPTPVPVAAPAPAAAAATETAVASLVSAPAKPAQAAAAASEARPASAATRAAPVASASRAASASAKPAVAEAPVVTVRPSAAPEPAAGSSEGDEETPFDKETAMLAAAKTTPRASREGSVDDLLDQALANPSERRQQAAATEAALPDAPSREEVTNTMAVLLPAIRGCAMGQTGLAAAGIVVRGDGRVASVELSGAPFAGTASGRCMEGVIRRARFSRFRQPTFRVRFPFAIQ